MAALPYYGSYARFQAHSKKEGAALLGADNIIGAVCEIVFNTDKSGHTSVDVYNPFGANIGKIQGKEAEDLLVCKAKGWTMHAILVCTYYSEKPEPGNYWGEVALVCFPNDDNAASFEAFTVAVAHMIGEGKRVEVDLAAKGIEQVVENNGSWLPSGRVAKLDLEPGTAVIKDHMTASESLIEMSRARNKGCLVGGWLFIILLVVGAFFLIKGLFGF